MPRGRSPDYPPEPPLDPSPVELEKGGAPYADDSRVVLALDSLVTELSVVSVLSVVSLLDMGGPPYSTLMFDVS